MAKLADEHCGAARADTPKLNDAEVALLLNEVPEWRVVEREGIKQLERAFQLRGFAQPLALATRVGERADAEDHHPRLVVEWRRLTVTWWTHVIKGLHRNDFIMAAQTDALYEALQQQSGR